MINLLLNNLPEFINDAIIDSIKLLPSLFIIFLLIEIFENYFARKIANIVLFSKKFGPILGACLAIIPQCGFSVVMTTLFVKRYITLGTLIAVYIATSDEAIPILLSNPEQFFTVAKIVGIKLILAIITGYFIDFVIKTKLHECKDKHNPCEHIKTFEPEKGCCKHEINENKIKNIIIHPIKHTFIVFCFILIICIGLNYLFTNFGENAINATLGQNSIAQIAFFAIFGLIPNCAVSVLITMAYLKGAISFGSVIAGLTSNAGLGLLVLFTKKESLKSFFAIVSILAITGFLAGIGLMLLPLI